MIAIELIIIGMVLALGFTVIFGLLTFWLYKLLNDKK